MKILGIMVIMAMLAGVVGANDYAEELRESKELERIADCVDMGGCDE